MSANIFGNFLFESFYLSIQIYTWFKFSSQVNFKILRLFIEASLCHNIGLYFLLIHIRIRKMYFFFSFPWIRKRSVKLVSPKIRFAVLFLTIHNYFAFFLEHLNNLFEITLSCILVVAWILWWRRDLRPL